MKAITLKLLNAVCHPVHTLAVALHMEGACGKRIKHGLCVIFMLSGSTLALSAGHWNIPHFAHVLVDVTAYGVHGIGAAPFATIILRKLALE